MYFDHLKKVKLESCKHEEKERREDLLYYIGLSQHFGAIQNKEKETTNKIIC